MKKLLLILSIILTGCATTSYLLPPKSVSPIKRVKHQIGVKRVKVPEYLMDNVLISQKGVEVEEVDIPFIESIDTMLTKRAIGILKEALDNPKVFLYPWEIKKKRGYIVSIDISDVIYKDGYITLKGRYTIIDMIASKKHIKDFTLQEESSLDKKELVEKLNELYSRVVLEIAEKIAK